MRQCVAGEYPLSIRFSMTPTPFAGTAKAVGFTHYYLASSVGTLTPALFKAAFDTAVTTAWAAALSPKWLGSTTFLYVRDMRDYANQEVIFLPAVNGAYLGTQGTDSLPQQACVLMKKTTGSRGKENRGFLHIPMVDEASTTDNDLTNAALARYVTLATALAVTITAGGVACVPQIYGASESNQLLGTTGISMAAITGISTARTIKTVKRRTQKTIYV